MKKKIAVLVAVMFVVGAATVWGHHATNQASQYPPDAVSTTLL